MNEFASLCHDRLRHQVATWWAALSDRRFQLALAVPLAAVLLLTLLFRLTAADLAISGMFYGGSAQWPFFELEPWNLLYRFGPYPGLVLGLLCTFIGVGGWLCGKGRGWGKAGLFFGLLLLLGPGVLVNGIVKPSWARPRPNEVVEFGGAYDFVAVGGFGSADHTRSFPSGHAAMGFIFMAPAFVLFRRHRGWALFFLCLGLAAGGLLGTSRVIQGRHFASDVLWSGAVIYFSGLSLSVLLNYWQPAVEEQPQPDTVGYPEPVILSFEAHLASLRQEDRDTSSRSASRAA